MKHSVNLIFWFWLPPLGYMLMIIFMSSLSDPGIGNSAPDYVLHSLGYFLLTLLLIRLALTIDPQKLLKITFLFFSCPQKYSQFFLFWQTASLLGVFIAIIFGITDEIHQYFVPERHCSFQDVIANFLGAFMAYGVSLVDHFLLTGTSFRRRWTHRASWLKSLSYRSYLKG